MGSSTCENGVSGAHFKHKHLLPDGLYERGFGSEAVYLGI